MRLRKNYFVNRGIQQREGICLTVFRPTAKGNFFTTLITGKFVFQPTVHTANVVCLVFLTSPESLALFVISVYLWRMPHSQEKLNITTNKKKSILNVEVFKHRSKVLSLRLTSNFNLFL